jgi:hypothetical protein
MFMNRKINIVKISVLPKVIYILNTIPIKSTPSFFFFRNRKSIQKFIWNLKGLQIVKMILKMNKVEGFTFPDFKTYSKATVIQTLYYWHKHRD